MPFSSADRARRQAHGPAVERIFGRLSPSLFRQAVQLKTHLAIHTSPTGRFANILSRPQDHPLLYMSGWLLDDLPPPFHPQTDLLDSLLPAGALAFAAGYLRQSISRPDNPFDDSFQPLVDELAWQEKERLDRLFASDSLFWAQHRAIWQEQAAAQSTVPNLDDDWRKLASQWAIAKIPVTAVALLSKQPDLLPRLLALTDHLNLIFAVLGQLAAVRRDSHHGLPSYVIDQIKTAADLDPRQPADPQRLLGALLVTDAVPRLIAHLEAHRQAVHGLAAEMSLPTVEHYTDRLAPLLTEVQSLLSLKSQPEPSSTLSQPFFAPVGNTLTAALNAAKSYVLSDPTFATSYEVQRGLPGAPRLVARAFPAGLVVEALSQSGHHLPQPVANIFDWARQSGWRYYENHPTLPPDADLLGLLLRLHRHAAPAEQPRLAQWLAKPLALLEQAVLPSGEISVWLEVPPEGVQLWGHRCAATQLNLLLGLVTFDARRYRRTIEIASAAVLAQFLADGFAAALYYGIPYTLWAGLALIRQLTAQPELNLPPKTLAAARSWFLEQFTAAAQTEPPSPQDAAFYLLANRATDLPLNPTWRTTLLKQQQHDGSWPAEPLYLIPHRHGVSWYASKLVTSAYCYHALKS